MDCGDAYVLMCQQATEIQAEQDDGYSRSLFTDDLDKTFPHRFTDWRDCIWWRVDERRDIWLPRQDQLQSMVDGNNLDGFTALYWWAMDGPPGEGWPTDYSSRFKTLEQVWLAHVMDEKFHKRWNGVEWVKVQP